MRAIDVSPTCRFSLLLLAAWLVACGSPTEGGQGLDLDADVCSTPGACRELDMDLDATPEAECEIDPDCARGRHCLEGECRAAAVFCDDSAGCAAQLICSNGGCREQLCAADAECGPLRVCAAGRCVEPGPTPECARDEDCPADAYCAADATCVLGCRLGAPSCDADEVCDAETRRCVSSVGCATDAECADDQFCDADAGLCADGCRVELDSCGASEACDSETRRCVCASDAACEADAYCADDGACTAGCRLDPDTCALGARCDAVTRTCAPLGCAGDDACPADFYCADDATCRAGCRDAGCAALLVCDLSTRSCVDGVRCRRDADCDADAYCTAGGLCAVGCREGGCPVGAVCELEARACGCGPGVLDTDMDGAEDCLEACPNDASKTAAGICGCGADDTDSDGDGTEDCNDLCPNNAPKVAAGFCGCAVADTDTDSDGTPNCNDLCPNDASKTVAGLCGCGVADTDSDNDGTPNCNDQCPNNAPKVAAGVCGCAVADTDTDSDGTPNCNDLCPNDPARFAVNACGACAALPGEVCDGADNDCDGVTDNAEANLCAADESCLQEVCVAAYVRIEPGVFTMGSPAGELGRGADEVQHQVTITRAFLMKTTEVTQAEWQAVMGNNPSAFLNCGANCPVEHVNWNDAVDYVNRLSDAAGLARCYDANRAFAGLGCLGYRLPTEAEWEYAARARTQTAYHTGVNTQVDCNNDPNLNLAGWYCGNSGGVGNTTHPVGLKQVNAWGLYDMHGNVSEWVQDWWDADYPAGAAVDPVGPAAGVRRGIRGGSWANLAQNARAAKRGKYTADIRDRGAGFRPARSL